MRGRSTIDHLGTLQTCYSTLRLRCVSVAPWQSVTMNKRILVVVGVLVVVIVGAILASFAMQSTPTPSAQNSGALSATPSPTAESTAPAAAAGTYVDYSSSAIADADADGKTLLFFYAPWCPQCRSIDDDILSMGVPAGVTIIKVDYDSNQDLRQQYGVTVQTTFVEVNSSGEGLQTYVAYDDPHLAAVLEAMF